MGVDRNLGLTMTLGLHNGPAPREQSIPQESPHTCPASKKSGVARR